MPTNEKGAKPKAEGLPAMRLSCTSFGTRSEIDALIDGTWETIATTHSIAGFDAEEIAQVIIRALKCESPK